MYALIFFVLVMLLVIYIVWTLNSRGFVASGSSALGTNNIWKSFPSNYQEGFKQSIAETSGNPDTVESYNKDDIFGLMKGSMDCPGSTYSNNSGNICLTKEQYRLLTTRGGNA
jgi:hypothetical protein